MVKKTSVPLFAFLTGHYDTTVLNNHNNYLVIAIIYYFTLRFLKDMICDLSANQNL